MSSNPKHTIIISTRPYGKYLFMVVNTEDTIRKSFWTNHCISNTYTYFLHLNLTQKSYRYKTHTTKQLLVQLYLEYANYDTVMGAFEYIYIYI